MRKNWTFIEDKHLKKVLNLTVEIGPDDGADHVSDGLDFEELKHRRVSVEPLSHFLCHLNKLNVEFQFEIKITYFTQWKVLKIGVTTFLCPLKMSKFTNPSENKFVTYFPISCASLDL